jgi:hypothetical protein
VGAAEMHGQLGLVAGTGDDVGGCDSLSWRGVGAWEWSVAGGRWSVFGFRFGESRTGVAGVWVLRVQVGLPAG